MNLFLLAAVILFPVAIWAVILWNVTRRYSRLNSGLDLQSAISTRLEQRRLQDRMLHQ